MKRSCGEPWPEDARSARALGLPVGTQLHVPESVDALAEIVASGASGDAGLVTERRTITWSSGQAPHTTTIAADTVICLSRLNGVRVDSERGVVEAEAGALLVQVEAALQRAGWSLALPFPSTLRVGDGLSGGPWTSALRRRLMSLTWVGADGGVHAGDAACVRAEVGPRVDGALPLPRDGAIPCVASFRARPAGTNARTQWWRVASLERAVALAEDAVREGWPHTLATLEYGRHVELGLHDGELRPVLAASVAALRGRLGSASARGTKEVLLGLSVRAELGVGAVLFAALGRRMGGDATAMSAANVEPAQWRADLANSMVSWNLHMQERWRESSSAGLLPDRREARLETGAALRCTQAILETHGRWLVRQTDFARAVPALSASLPLLHASTPPTKQQTISVTGDGMAVARVRRWRHQGDQSALTLRLDGLGGVALTDDGDVVAGIAATLAEVELMLRGVGRTLGVRPDRSFGATVLDLLLDAPSWRAAACASAAHGLCLDAMGTVREVRGVDRFGGAGTLERWVRVDGGAGLDAAPLEVRFRGWRWVKRDTLRDWCWLGTDNEAALRAFDLAARSPHLLRLAVHGSGSNCTDRANGPGARILVRTGGLRPGERRAIDHVRAALPGVMEVDDEAWRVAPLGFDPPEMVTRRHCRTTSASGQTWTSRFTRGRAARCTPGGAAASDARADRTATRVLEVLLCP